MAYHLAGDSTVAPMKPEERPMTGWGGFLGEYVDTPVYNHAFGGATTESFERLGSWQRLVAGANYGDTVLLQFGHNDQKLPEMLASRGGFSARLAAMATEARNIGASVVLCTPCERRWFDGESVVPTHGDYPNAVRDLALEQSLPLIDLTVFTTWLYEDMGDLGSRALLSHFGPGEASAWPDGLVDDTHFRVEGARRIAAFVAKSLRAIERRDGDAGPRGSELVA